MAMSIKSYSTISLKVKGKETCETQKSRWKKSIQEFG